MKKKIEFHGSTGNSFGLKSLKKIPKVGEEISVTRRIESGDKTEVKSISGVVRKVSHNINEIRLTDTGEIIEKQAIKIFIVEW